MKPASAKFPGLVPKKGLPFFLLKILEGWTFLPFPLEAFAPKEENHPVRSTAARPDHKIVR